MVADRIAGQPLPREIRVELEGDWIVARQGRDETGQAVKLEVWGSLREPGAFRHGFEQLDDDPEPEYVVVSRNPGTGPYYKLQIIDFLPAGILTWSLDSHGRPRVEEGKIYLGTAREPESGRKSFDYTHYVYSATGVTPDEGGH